MKINCDIGEGFDTLDAQIMPYIDMANIACGLHASNPFLMSKTIDLALQHNVSIGAHPGYPDPEGFGRRSMPFTQTEIIELILYQYGALKMLCDAKGATVDYIKPHGALYNAMMSESEVFDAVLQAMKKLPRSIPLMVLANNQQEQFLQKAQRIGINILFEVFSDRAYDKTGHLLSRNIDGAVLSSSEAIEKRMADLLDRNIITTIEGHKLPISADTLCIHGDVEEAVEIAKLCRNWLSTRGISRETEYR